MGGHLHEDNKGGSSIATSMVLEESPDRIVVLLYYKLLYTITMFIMIVISVFDSELF